MSQCRAVTESGQQCIRSVEKGNKYCWQHAPKSNRQTFLRRFGKIVGSVFAAATTKFVADELEKGTTSLVKKLKLIPTKTEEPVFAELANYGIEVTGKHVEADGRTLYFVRIPPIPEDHGTSHHVYSQQIVGYTHDLAELLRRMQRP